MKHLICTLVLASAALAAPAAKADSTNLVYNGSFEQLLDGWTAGGSTTYLGLNSYGAQDGDFAIAFGSPGSDSTLSQTVADAAGHTMQLSWWANSDGSYGNRFDVAVNGTNLFYQQLPAEGWTQYFVTFTGTGSDTLVFGGANGPSYNHLDNIALTDVGAPTPVPPAVTPEPSSLALLGTGLLSCGGVLRRRFVRG